MHHVISRGNTGRIIFVDDEDRLSYLGMLEKATTTYGWIIHAYCLMDNHFHLLLETPDPTLSKGMHYLNGTYSKRFNRRHDMAGHLLKNRFNSILLARNEHLLALSKYIALNPVRAGIVRKPEQYRWSSYRSTIGKDIALNFLSVDFILSLFSEDREKARMLYRLFVEKDMEDEVNRDQFIEPWKTEQRLAKKENRHPFSGSNVKIHRNTQRLTLSEIFKDVCSKTQRNELIRVAYKEHGYTQSEISSCLGLSQSLICMIIRGNR